LARKLKKILVRHWWLTLVILATQEAEIKEDCGLQDPISKIGNTKIGLAEWFKW
jgi:hypothetical protein